jgi:hypothetical protein
MRRASNDEPGTDFPSVMEERKPLRRHVHVTCSFAQETTDASHRYSGPTPFIPFYFSSLDEIMFRLPSANHSLFKSPASCLNLGRERKA